MDKMSKRDSPHWTFCPFGTDLLSKNGKRNVFFGHLALLILIIGILIRIVGITDMPNALNCDEASAGYEAFSILNYGIDRNGNKLPVFLVSWGSGQNVLLTYLMIPFVKVLGLNVLSVRLPMAILGCISLIILFLLLKRISNEKLATIGLAFFAICPWHIMKSRWGLESNLFPDLVLIFIYLLVKGIEDKNKIVYYLSFVVAGITAYSYGTSYYFLPVFLIPLLFILVKKKKITIKSAILSIAIVGIISLPVILYVIINTFGLQQINLPFMTIPKLDVNRYKELTSIFSIKFFMKSMIILIGQYDKLPWNSLPIFGITYIFSIVFTIIGIVNSFKKNKFVEIKYNYIFNIWFIVSIILTFICKPNINRLNIIIFPIIYYTIQGIYLSIQYNKKIAIAILILYIVYFGIFVQKYCGQNYDEYFTFESDIEEVINYVNRIEDKQIHIKDRIYIFTLFYSQYDTRNFINTVEYKNTKTQFREVKSFGKYYFDDFDKISIDKDNIYVIKKKDKEKFDLENCKITELKKYIVIENKE